MSLSHSFIAVLMAIPQLPEYSSHLPLTVLDSPERSSADVFLAAASLLLEQSVILNQAVNQEKEKPMSDLDVVPFY